MAYNESKAAEINAHAVASTATPVAGAPDIEANRFVKIVAPNVINYATAAGDAVIGVTGCSGDIGDLVEVYYSGIHKVFAGAAITAGQFVTAGADGKAVVGTQANHIGKAIDDAALGAMVTVSLE